MPGLINDQMLGTFAIVSDMENLPTTLNERYHGLADRLGLYIPFVPGERDDYWKRLITELKEI